MSGLSRKMIPTVSTMAAAAGFVIFAPSEVEASFGQQTLRFGMEHPDVVELQTVLKEKGYFTYHTATGYFGTITEDALKRYQKDHQLTPDGIAGPLTFNQLHTGTSTVTKEKPAESVSTPAENASDSSAGQIVTQRTLREGTRGDDVRLLQLALMEKGFFSHHTATGYYGSLTKAAVTSYQRARGLTVDGLAGPVTLGRINGELNTNVSIPETVPSTDTSGGSQSTANENRNLILREGDRGDEVRNLQTMLKQSGHYQRDITGVYGPVTKSAVIAFQRSKGLTPDGIAGPITLGALKQAEPTNGGNQGGSQVGAGTFLLKEGHSGPQVRELQERLKATGHYSYAVTGVFGPITRSAVTQFQRQWNMVADGMVTSSVWERVEEISSIHMGDASGGQTAPETYNVMNLIADAADQIGVPYQWGGTSTAGFDCSGFIQYVFKKNGVQMPRTVAEQWRSVQKVNAPRPGDLVFFETYKAGPSHNGIYIGNDQFIHSGSSTGVTIANLQSSYWKQRYLGAGRVNR